MTTASVESTMTVAGSQNHYRLKNDPMGSHMQIVTLVRELNRGPILDVGSAQGMLGELLQGSGLVIDAVEPNPAWAKAAKPFYRELHQGTIETAPLKKDYYNVVVCGDVLEHTVDPAGVLRLLRTHATPDATFIISLPNVAHISVRLMLLLGYFPEMERGILDKTHLHFYTRETAQKLLERAGLKVEKRLATVAPLSEIWPRGQGSLLFKALWHVQHVALVVFRSLFAYQWLMVARPTRS
jgi:2-polyprenyl-3-methyl-5-hydroxy-6-metoxy-1,4-benzoquinol methylase